MLKIKRTNEENVNPIDDIDLVIDAVAEEIGILSEEYAALQRVKSWISKHEI